MVVTIRSRALFQEFLGFCEGIYLANIHQAEVVRNEAIDGLAIADAEVEVYDAELIGPLAKVTEERGVHIVDAGKGKFAITA